MKLGIVVGSTREGRVSEKYAKWVAAAAGKMEGVEVTLLDLRDYDLPMFNEAISPQYNPNRVVEGDVKKWLDALNAQDALVLVTPEYNRSIPGVLKNALDFVAYELAKKPVAVATHGSSNGAQAVAQLRGIIPGALAVTTPTFIGLPYMEMQNFTDAGEYNSDMAEMYSNLLGNVLAEVKWYSDALAAARG
jgi:NAD(P)H-dependent FMN reductase